MMTPTSVLLRRSASIQGVKVASKQVSSAHFRSVAESKQQDIWTTRRLDNLAASTASRFSEVMSTTTHRHDDLVSMTTRRQNALASSVAERQDNQLYFLLAALFSCTLYLGLKIENKIEKVNAKINVINYKLVTFK